MLVEGRLSDRSVETLEASWVHAKAQLNGKPVCIDLSGVTFIDDKGRELLARIIRSGAELRTAGIMTRTVVEEIINEVEDKRTK